MIEIGEEDAYPYETEEVLDHPDSDIEIDDAVVEQAECDDELMDPVDSQEQHQARAVNAFKKTVMKKKKKTL